jgi:hypothetical protein
MEKGNPGEPCQFVAAMVDHYRFAAIPASPQVSAQGQKRRLTISAAIDSRPLEIGQQQDW